jgi:effector-binding domain-containing protein
MNVEPKLETREPQPYAALRVEAPLPFGPILGPSWNEVHAWLESQGVKSTGPCFIRYLTTDMESGKMDLELGFPIAAVVPGNGRITTGLLPGGRYATYVYF